MKKILFLLLLVFIIVIVVIVVAISALENDVKILNKENEKFEYYNRDDLMGTDIANIVSLAIDKNEKADVPKDKNKQYIYENNVDYINVEVKFNESTEYFRMENINRLGIQSFIKNYNIAEFKCIKIDYHKNGKIKEMIFDQKPY